MKKYLIIILLIWCWNCTPKKPENNKINFRDKNEMRIGFGSCLKQNKPMPIFESIKAEDLDLFLMIGDNVYGDSRTEDLKELRSAYNRQQQNFEKMKLNLPFEAIWDDHDYGLNDAGKEYLFKENSKELFLDFWNIPLNDPRRSRARAFSEVPICNR